MKFKILTLQNTDRELLEYALESMDKDQHHFTKDDDPRDLRMFAHCIKELSERLAKLPIPEK